MKIYEKILLTSGNIFGYAVITIGIIMTILLIQAVFT